MLTRVFDELTSGRRIRSIRYTDNGGFADFGINGIAVAVQGDESDAEAWIAFDETGIWLSYNAHRSSRNGYHGMEACEDPLSSVSEIVFV